MTSYLCVSPPRPPLLCNCWRRADCCPWTGPRRNLQGTATSTFSRQPTPNYADRFLSLVFAPPLIGYIKENLPRTQSGLGIIIIIIFFFIIRAEISFLRQDLVAVSCWVSTKRAPLTESREGPALLLEHEVVDVGRLGVSRQHVPRRRHLLRSERINGAKLQHKALFRGRFKLNTSLHHCWGSLGLSPVITPPLSLSLSHIPTV